MTFNKFLYLSEHLLSSFQMRSIEMQRAAVRLKKMVQVGCVAHLSQTTCMASAVSPTAKISRMMRTVSRLRPSQCAPGSQCSPLTPASGPQVSSFSRVVSFHLGPRPKGSERPVFVWSLKPGNLMGSSSPLTPKRAASGQPVLRGGQGKPQPEEGSQASTECCVYSRGGNILKGPPELGR